MKHTQAAAVAVAVSALTAGMGSRLIAPPSPVEQAQSAVSALAMPQARGVLETIPQSSLWLGLRMEGGKMFAMNGSGGADADVTPHIILEPLRPTPPTVLILPSPLPPGVQILPQPAPHR